MGRGQILERVISGGQTGVDQAALRVARELNYKTGGVAPRGWRTDVGPAPWLGTQYNLTEHKVSAEYAPRTRENVRTADGTVIFDAEVEGEADYYNSKGSAGCRLTWKMCKDLKKVVCVNPTVEELQAFLLQHPIRILNVAGNRLRTHPESAHRAEIVLRRGLIPF